MDLYTGTVNEQTVKHFSRLLWIFFPNDESHFIIKLIKFLQLHWLQHFLLEWMTSLPVSVLGIGIVRRQSIGYWVLGAELGIVLTLVQSLQLW